MYKNIIFDFGGVVVDFAPKDFLMDHFMNRRAEEETYELVFGSQEWQIWTGAPSPARPPTSRC